MPKKLLQVRFHPGMNLQIRNKFLDENKNNSANFAIKLKSMINVTFPLQLYSSCLRFMAKFMYSYYFQHSKSCYELTVIA
jgi:hypothetical protein